MWLRVFSPTADEVPPATLAEHLHAAGLAVVPHFRGDEHGWTGGELVLPGGGTPVRLARYLTDVDDLRADLNTFAAELETMAYSPHHRPLMERVIQTKQLVTIRRPLDHADEIALDRAVEGVVRFLAAAGDGVYQIDGRGWFTAAGELLVEEH
ncbi:MAG: hypothetical protein U0871_21400 [Gemmataceae bacterium]